MSKRMNQEGHPGFTHVLALMLLLGGASAHAAEAGQAPSPNTVPRPQLEKAARDAALIPINARFDLRDHGGAAPSEPDSACASCWSSAATYVMESKLTAAEGAFVDLSEAHMQRSQAGACDLGASAEAASAYLTAWRGPISEKDYQALGHQHDDTALVRAHVDEVVWLPVRQGPLDNAQIKQAIRSQGPVYASVSWRGIGNQEHQAYYWPGNSPAHAVALLGWDDRFDRNKFTYTVQGTVYTPPGDGAFIARNNNGGFYYVSYYDGTIGYNAVVAFGTTLGIDVDRLYQHDPYGTRSLITPSDIPGNLDDYVPKIIGANVFTAETAELLVGLGFFQHPYPGRNEVYRLSVHLNPSSAPFSPGNEAAHVDVEPRFGGYHSVALEHPVRLKPGQRFAVLLTGHEVDAEQNAALLWVEKKPFSKHFQAAPAESYISRDGSNWFDLTTLPGVNHATGDSDFVYGNLAIKAYAMSAPTLPKVESKWDPANGAIELSNVIDSPVDVRVSVRRARAGADGVSPVSSRDGWLKLGAGERVAVAIPDIDAGDPAAIQMQLGYQPSRGKLVALKEWRPIGELKIAALRVETTSPLPGDNLPYPNPEISARFSRDIKLGAGAEQIIIQSPDSTLSTQVAVQGRWLQIYPQGSLEPSSLGGKTWTVIIPADALTDSFGTSLPEAYSWSFSVIGVN